MKSILLAALLLVSVLSYSQELPNQSSRPTPAYQPKIIVGGLFMGAGIGLLASDFVYAITTDSNKEIANTQARKHTLAGIGISGGCFTVAGAILLGIGGVEQSIYKSKNTSLNLNVYGDRLGLALNF